MNPDSAARSVAIEGPLEAPRSFDGYSLERLLGRGGMGEVYLARDTLLDRAVAIKLIAAGGDAAARRRFLVEARAVARLEHPNVVGVYRVGEVGGQPYFASEFVRGTPLDQLERPIGKDMAMRIAMDVSSGLATAHRRGVLHRDIKPANAILSDEGTVKLLDFGIAKLIEARSGVDVAPSKAARSDVEVTGATRVDGPDGSPTAPPPDPEATRAEGRRLRSGVMRSGLETQGEPPPSSPRDLTRTGVALGTPRYMAPEVWRGEPATFASDVYSVGAMLFRLCAARPVFPCRDLDELRRAVLEDDPDPLHRFAPELDERFCAVVDRCLRRDPTERFVSAVELRQAFSDLLPAARDAVVPEGNPYRGLACFEAEHKNLYFGRDSESRMVLDRLASDGFVLVAGDSGVGKSSLCRAGVAPRIVAWLGEGRRWSTHTYVPGPHPVAALAAVLQPILGEEEQALARDIRDDPGGVARRIRAHAGADGGVLLFVDQLEELVTIAEPEGAQAVSELLGWLALPAPGARLLATARGDFLSRLAQLPRLGELVGRALFFLRPLSEERVREAVVGPAAAKGVTFASDDVVDELVGSTIRAGGGALPLLQFALAEVWDAREGAQSITGATLERVGGVDGALCRHADGVIAALPSDQRDAARRVMTSLVSPDGTRSCKSGAELGEDLSDVALALVRARLLVAREGPEGTRYEIAHEALIDNWQQLRSWLSSDQEARAIVARLEVASTEWERLGRSRDALLGERQLAEIDGADLEPTPRVQGFILASRRHQRRRRWLRVGAVLAVPLLVLAAWLTVEMRQRHATDQRVEAHRARAATLLEDAAAVERQSLEARQRGLDAFDQASRDAEQIWKRYRGLTGELREIHARAARELEAALALDGDRLDVREAFADLLFDRALLAEEHGDAARVRELMGRLALFDDGSRQERWGEPADVSFDTPADVYRYESTGATLTPVVVARSRSRLKLPPGSYLAVAGAVVRLPFLARRGAPLALSLAGPPEEAIPAGFVYVPPGRFLIGSGASDVQRRDFFHAVPLHEVETQAYLIARRETTFRDWIAFLDALAESERSERIPRVGKGGFKGSLTLTGEPGAWRLTMLPTTVVLDAGMGEEVVYPHRERAATHDWLDLPVVGITGADARAYARWLRDTGRVPGARLCGEREWERAARGADGRPYPHGFELAPADANHDATYGKVAEAMGPDAVGSHPRSRSPFGLDDMAGNVWEWTRSAASPTGFAARGGSWYFGPSSSHVADREETEASFRDLSVGLRICADVDDLP